LSVDAGPGDDGVLAAPAVGEPARRLRHVALAGEDLHQRSAVPVESSVEELAPQLGGLLAGQEALSAVAPAGPAEREVDRPVLRPGPAGVATAAHAALLGDHRGPDRRRGPGDDVGEPRSIRPLAPERGDVVPAVEPHGHVSAEAPTDDGPDLRLELAADLAIERVHEGDDEVLDEVEHLGLVAA